MKFDTKIIRNKVTPEATLQAQQLQALRPTKIYSSLLVITSWYHVMGMLSLTIPSARTATLQMSHCRQLQVVVNLLEVGMDQHRPLQLLHLAPWTVKTQVSLKQPQSARADL